MIQYNPNSGRGFTLVELTVVLLLIALLASVSVRETTEFNFQTRYEQTKERLEIIKQAILGNPKQLINDQQAVSGFVADMGRLPGSVRDLLQASACVTAGVATQSSLSECTTAGGTWTWFNTPCTDGISTTSTACSAASGLWLAQQIHPASGLKHGWHGPYLTVSGNPNNSDALTDGWGRMGVNNDYTSTIDESISDYGWNFFELSTLTNSSDDKNFLIIQSFGKDQLPDISYPNPLVENYDNDYPENSYSFVNASFSTYYSSSTIYYPNPTVRKQDWLLDISNGISVTFLKLNKLLPLSFCTDPTKIAKATCTSPDIWYGGCSLPGYYNKTGCEAAGTWSNWTYCSDGASTTKTACETAGKIWYVLGEGFGCSDQINSNKTECISSAGTWRSCSDNGTITTKTDCTNAGLTWLGDDLYQISNALIQPALPTIPNLPICMKIFYRQLDSTIGVLISDENTATPNNEPKFIYPDGSSQTIRFKNFRDKDGNLMNNLPIGSNAIGIYQYDGKDCQTSNVFYPINHQMPMQVDFHPNATLPVINW